jgi:two-component system cell cycle response regulator
MRKSARLVVVLLGVWVALCELRGLGLHWIPVGPEKWLHLIVMGAGAALCLLRAAVIRRERGAWLLLGLGVMAWVLGELYFTAVLWTDSSPPVPSPADAGYLSLPPLVFLGLILLARSRIRNLPKTVWADGVAAGLAAGAMSAAVVFKPVLAVVAGNGLSVATNLSYPIMDLMLLGFICGVLAVGGRRVDRRFGVIALGIACFWAADTIYLIKVAHGTWVSGGPYDPGWWTIAVCIAAAAWMPPKGRAATVRRSEAISVPIASALVSMGILVAGTLTDVTLPAIALASGALVSVLLRLVLTFGAHQSTLDRSRHEALTDPLTALGNRRAFTAALADRLDCEEPEPTILVLLDLDGFKGYNDDFGHGAGDALLQRMAGALATVLDTRGDVYRMGGDEFCLLLPGGEEGEALLDAAAAALSDQDAGPLISASLGSVRLPEETGEMEEALRLADQRMYAHKHWVRRTGAGEEVGRALLAAVAARDPRLATHVDDVAECAAALAVALGCPPVEVESIRAAAELHDVGKLGVPESILHKPGPLTDQEWDRMRNHTIAGERIIVSSPALASVAPLVRSSHERWDGGGYPDGLAGEEIPLGARIIAVSDSYHAMTADRGYRQAMSEEVALGELRSCSGTQFDPVVVRAFLALRAGMEDRQPSINGGGDRQPSISGGGSTEDTESVTSMAVSRP